MKTGVRTGSSSRRKRGKLKPGTFEGLIPGYSPRDTAGDSVFDQAAADRACQFFVECLHHVKGELAGKPFVLQPWQQAIVANLFGWKRPDGSRRYRTSLIFVPRKNGKTSLASGIILYMLFCDGEPGAEIYSAAADRDQARLVFEQAAGMVRGEEALRERATVFTHAIALRDYSGSYKPISADAHTSHGYNSHCIVIDELHAQPDRRLVDVLNTSTGSRRQPLVVYITTSDYARESICNEIYDYAAKVRDGIIPDPSFLPVIFEPGPEDDWHDKKLWERVNPNLGISLSRAYLETEYQRAIEIPGYENTFKRLHLNLRTEQATRWLPMDSWDTCGEAFDPASLEGKPCYAGLDLATTTDLAALVLYFPEDGNAVLPYFWCPEENAEKRERRDRVPYVVWHRQGLIQLTPGNVTDYDRIHEDLKELREKYEIKEIAIDRWNSTQLQTQLMGDGFNVVGFGQGFASMTAPSKQLETLILSGHLRHGGNAVLRWMASNVSTETDAAGNLKPSKKASTEKIDGIVALIMAIGRAAVRPQELESVYAERGLTFI